MLIESQQGSTRILTLDRQDAGNALSLELVVALEGALAKCRTESSLRSVIITGAGEKFFCTGGDVKRYSTIEDAEGLHEIFDRASGLLDFIETCELPVFAAINASICSWVSLTVLGFLAAMALCLVESGNRLTGTTHSAIARNR